MNINYMSGQAYSYFLFIYTYFKVLFATCLPCHFKFNRQYDVYMLYAEASVLLVPVAGGVVCLGCILT